ncbi:Hypothetical_protein [Hexamita inflata]|uniref:Hypothetical_protein n=1 Tax=Hexamita inflata TaxID=28002 RepID=A0AA86U0H7_9EUKA|nr:Hypothetical protein HINF_LOCUS24730 [Hexamita inflata]CAI9937090.1 Hypothetical protein HINF_LOCUS24735 [Hexamita inflata]
MQNPQNFLKTTGVPTKKCVSYKSGSQGDKVNHRPRFQRTLTIFSVILCYHDEIWSIVNCFVLKCDVYNYIFEKQKINEHSTQLLLQWYDRNLINDSKDFEKILQKYSRMINILFISYIIHHTTFFRFRNNI